MPRRGTRIGATERALIRLLRFFAQVKCATSFGTILVLTIGFGVFGVYIFSKSSSQIECPSRTFRCPEESKCVGFRYLCDGQHHCLRGSDELAIHCTDLSNLEHIFESAMKMNVVRNNSNQEPKIEMTVQGGTGACGNFIINGSSVDSGGCLCKRGYAFCQETNWPADFDWTNLPGNTTRLVLRQVFNENMSVWDPKPMAHMTALQVLSFENHHNHLNFNWKFLQNREALGKLYLAHNGIKALQPGDFEGMKRLQWLFLSTNLLVELNYDAIGYLTTLVVLDASYNRIVSNDEFRFPPLEKLESLHLQGNRFVTIHENLFINLRNIWYLNLGENDIEAINTNAFQHNPLLKELDLSTNKLHRFDPNWLSGLSYITKLSLDANPTDFLPPSLFRGKPLLKSLDLRGLEIRNADIQLFAELHSLDFVFFKKFEYCQYVPRVPKCRPNTDGMSSTTNLLQGVYLRIAVWICGIMTIIGNTIVLTNRCFTHQPSKFIIDIFVNHLAAADALMGLYFLTLAVKDVEFRDDYNAYAHIWSTSGICTLVGSLAMISREVSLFILTTVSMERYFVITGPYSYQRLTKRSAFGVIVAIWGAGIILGVVPILTPGLKHSFYGSSGLCFSLHLNEPFAFGWEYSSFVFVFVNAFCLIVTTGFYGKLFWKIKRTRLSTTVEIGETKMATRVFMMVMIDFFCWVPIIFIKLATLWDYEIQPDMHAWAIIIILPLNAAINPLIYTLSSTKMGIRFIQFFIKVTHLGRYHSYYDGTQFTATSDTDTTKWSITDWKYEDRQVERSTTPVFSTGVN